MSLKRKRRPSLSDLYAEGTKRKLVKQQVHLYKREAKRTFSPTCSLPLVYEEDKVLTCGWLLTIFPLELLRIVFEYSGKAPEDIYLYYFGIRMGPQLPVLRIASLYHHFRRCVQELTDNLKWRGFRWRIGSPPMQETILEWVRREFNYIHYEKKYDPSIFDDSVHTEEIAIDLPYKRPHDPSRYFYIRKFIRKSPPWNVYVWDPNECSGDWTVTECREASFNTTVFEELYGFLLHRRSRKHYVSVVYEFF